MHPQPSQHSTADHGLGGPQGKAQGYGCSTEHLIIASTSSALVWAVLHRGTHPSPSIISPMAMPE